MLGRVWKNKNCDERVSLGFDDMEMRRMHEKKKFAAFVRLAKISTPALHVSTVGPKSSKRSHFMIKQKSHHIVWKVAL